MTSNSATIGGMQRRTFIAAWATTFLINVAWGVVFPLRNIYIHDQGISLVLIGTISTAGAVAFSISGVFIGRLSDRLGKRRLLIVAMLPLAGLVSLGFLAASDFIHFLVLIALDMFLIGGYVVLMDTLVSSELPAEKRGGGFGWYRISGSIGFALSAALLGLLTANFGIRSIFILSALALFTATVFVLFIKETPQPVEASTAGDPVLDLRAAPPRANIVSSLAASGLVLFIVAGFISALGTEMAYPFLNIYLNDTLEATAGQIGFVTTVGVLAEIPTMLLLGSLSDRIGRGIVLLFGFFVMSLSWLIVFQATNLIPIYIAKALAGMSIIRYTVGVAMISDRIPTYDRATTIGVSNLSFGLGGILGPVLGGALIERTTTRTVFAAAFIVNLAATLIYSVQVWRERPKRQSVRIS